MDKFPKFIMLIGLPASGKSTLAKSLSAENANALILSSDEIRKEIYGDETCQNSPENVFGIMQQRTNDALRCGKDVIYDATNINRKHRRHLLSQLPKCKKIAYICWARYEECVQRDKNRSRTVGESVINKMIRLFQPPYYNEGWDKIEIIYNGEKYTDEDYIGWLNIPHDNPHHNNTVLEHTQNVVNFATSLSVAETEKGNIANAYQAAIVTAAAYLHDIGKKFVKSFKNSKGEPVDIAHYYNHHNVSSYLAIGCKLLDDLKHDDKLLVVWLVNVHMEPFMNTKYYKTLPKELRQYVDIFHACDVKGA